MTLNDLVNLDAGSVIDWLIENQYNFALVPREPTPEMRDAFHAAQEEWEDGEGCSPDHQWTAMLKTCESQGS